MWPKIGINFMDRGWRHAWRAESQGWSTKQILDAVSHTKDKIVRLVLDENRMDTFPAELCDLFPNVQSIFLWNNEICTLSRKIGNLTNLGWLNIARNNLTALPLTMTRLIRLESLDLRSNPQLPEKFQIYVAGVQHVQQQLHLLVTYFELARRSATVLVGLAKLKRSQILRTFYIPFEFIREMAQLVCSSHASHKWDHARGAALGAK
jgi:Leucine-rich repeat (LRR) protein